MSLVKTFSMSAVGSAGLTLTVVQLLDRFVHKRVAENFIFFIIGSTFCISWGCVYTSQIGLENDKEEFSKKRKSTRLKKGKRSKRSK